MGDIQGELVTNTLAPGSSLENELIKSIAKRVYMPIEETVQKLTRGARAMAGGLRRWARWASVSWAMAGLACRKAGGCLKQRERERLSRETRYCKRTTRYSILLPLVL